MARPKTHTDELRTELLACAIEAVAEKGIGSLTLRELTVRANTSTSAVYSCFGNKEALQHAVLVQALTDFAVAQEEVAADADPVDYLAALGLQYVTWALDNPRLYEAMYGASLAGVESTPELQAAEARAMACVATGVASALESGMFRAGELATVVTALWAQVHGLASLMISGQLPEGADPAVAAFSTIEGWRA